MKDTSDSLLAAVDWLLTEIAHTPYGRLSIGVQIHSGQISKVFRSVEESTMASQKVSGRAEDGGR